MNDQDSRIRSKSFDRFRISIATILTVTAITHIFLIAIAQLPINIYAIELREITTIYSDTIFRQNWHLFAPNPSVGIERVSIRWQVDGKFTGWYDPFEGIRKQHERNCASGKVYLLRAINAQSGRVQRDWELITSSDDSHQKANGLTQKGRLEECKSAVSFYSFIWNNYRPAPDESITALQVRFIELLPKDFSSRNDPLPYGGLMITELPVRRKEFFDE
jgi:hypothetical protein